MMMMLDDSNEMYEDDEDDEDFDDGSEDDDDYEDGDGRGERVRCARGIKSDSRATVERIASNPFLLAGRNRKSLLCSIAHPRKTVDMRALFALFLLAAPALSTKVQPCYSEPKTLNVQVGSCVDKCVFTVGTNVSHEVKFKTDHAVTSLTAVLQNGTDTLLTNTAACSALSTGSCPLSAGETAVYPYYVYASSALEGYLNITFKLEDQNSKVVACYKLNVTITE
ncbi:uncharacterized protein LOC134536327 [Bacillus rossius redtenbacheri]|uniref:uncharacterized protein LOC134536327 n=1 Tax=Bacillus rossius redtenbacheri TaxID=93214 RepID=UPI002FDD4FFC